MKTYGKVAVQSRVFLTSALVGGVVRFTLRLPYSEEKRSRHSLDRRLDMPNDMEK
jgi:hypothetical protein